MTLLDQTNGRSEVVERVMGVDLDAFRAELLELEHETGKSVVGIRYKGQRGG